MARGLETKFDCLHFAGRNALADVPVFSSAQIAGHSFFQPFALADAEPISAPRTLQGEFVEFEPLPHENNVHTLIIITFPTAVIVILVGSSLGT